MEKSLFYGEHSNSYKHYTWLLPGVLMAIFFGWFLSSAQISTNFLFILLPFIIGFVVLVFFKPRIGLITYIFYCFLMPTLGKHIEGIQFGLGIDALLILTWLGVIFHRSNKYKYRYLNNDLVWLAVVWFIITVLEIGNPAKPNIQGWLQEMRSATLYWVLTIPLVHMLFRKRSDMDLFLYIVIGLSLFGALYGIKQLYIGPDGAENRWLEAGARKTHILFGKLRVFSYYSEAAQFGASQAHLAIICIILATGPHSLIKKLFYAVAGVFIFYGMMISGTRGAIGGLIGGAAVFLILSKQTKILILGAIAGIGFIGMLKYTKIGNDNDQIRRMRSSMDPNDPSLQVRFANQKILKDILSSKPFGTGVGTIGQWGTTYNKDKLISTIPPDSLFVKNWAMYGVIGFTIWLGIMLYILGKSAGIIWKIRDPILRNQLSALCAGTACTLLCSYGNEVQNAMPSSAIVYISWAFIWLGPRWDSKEPKPLQHA